MLDVDKILPKDPDELRQFTALLLAEVKSQAVLIEKLRHQLAGQRHHRFGSSSETIEQLQLALETSEIAVAKITAKLRLPEEEPKDKPKPRPIPDHIPRMEVELTTGDDDCAQCGGGLRRLGEDVTEELEYAPGRFIVNRIVRPRFACSGCEAFTQAALPSGYCAAMSRKGGRTKGGVNSKLHIVTAAHGRPERMFLTAGQRSDYIGAGALLNDLPVAKHMLADRGYDADWYREELENMGIEPCIPLRKGRKTSIPHDAARYRKRDKIENCFARLKDWRRVATRYDRCPNVVLSACALAAVVMFWL